jgi:chromate reductase
MISIIAGTDRSGSHSAEIARNYHHIITQMGEKASVFSLASLPADFFTAGVYGKPPQSFEQVMNTVIVPADKLLFVIPEYNGSFPGILKHFMDMVHPSAWAGKRAALVGVATGRSGNLRGLDHFTGVLHYLKVHVHHMKPLLSSIHLHLDEHKDVVNAEYKALMNQQVMELLQF